MSGLCLKGIDHFQPCCERFILGLLVKRFAGLELAGWAAEGLSL